MATSITGRQYKVTDDVRDLITRKLDRIVEKLFDDVIDVRVVLQVEKYRNICEILITGKEHDVKSVQESDESMQDAINRAATIAEGLARVSMASRSWRRRFDTVSYGRPRRSG